MSSLALTTFQVLSATCVARNLRLGEHAPAILRDISIVTDGLLNSAVLSNHSVSLWPF